MRPLTLSAIALALPCCAAAQSVDEMVIARSLSTHVMQVRAATLGSAVAIAQRLAVTNCHVLAEASSISVSRGGIVSRATLRNGNTGHDLCLLDLQSDPSQPARIRQSATLMLGEPVYAVGFGVGRLSFGSGRIEGLYATEDGIVVRTDAAFAPGASGGALFDKDENLVGILTFFRRGAVGSSYWAMPTEWVTALTQAPAADVDRSRLPLWSSERAATTRFLDVAGDEVDGRWERMRSHAQRWLDEEPGNREAQRALDLANTRLQPQR